MLTRHWVRPCDESRTACLLARQNHRFTGSLLESCDVSVAPFNIHFADLLARNSRHLHKETRSEVYCKVVLFARSASEHNPV